MTNKNFGSAIATLNLGRYKFDFFNNKNIFPDRVKKYNQLLTSYISNDYLKNSYIAGGFFTKYIEEYKNEQDNQDINVFVNIANVKKQKFFYKEEELREVLKNPNDSNIINEYFNGVIVTFKPNNIDFCKNLVGVSIIKIHVCNLNANLMLNKFTYEPCKIAFEYEKPYLLISHWYLVGGLMQNNNLYDNDELAEKYKKKNFVFNDRIEEYDKKDRCIC